MESTLPPLPDFVPDDAAERVHKFAEDTATDEHTDEDGNVLKVSGSGRIGRKRTSEVLTVSLGAASPYDTDARYVVSRVSEGGVSVPYKGDSLVSALRWISRLQRDDFDYS